METPKQSQTMCDRQNIRNIKSKCKQAKRDQSKTHGELRYNSLRKESTIMMNHSITQHIMKFHYMFFTWIVYLTLLIYNQISY